MKHRILSILSALVMGLTFTACGPSESASAPSVSEGDKAVVQDKLNKTESKTDTSDEAELSDTENTNTSDGTNILVAYFSRADENYNVGTVVNALVFLCMLGLMYSGIVISKHIFAFVNVGGTMTARTIHMLCAYWGLALMSIHLGMHTEQMIKRIKLRSSIPLIALGIIFAVLAVIGIYCFIELKFLDNMFGRVQFVFIDDSASVMITTLEYFCVMVLFAQVGYLLNKVTAKNA